MWRYGRCPGGTNRACLTPWTATRHAQPLIKGATGIAVGLRVRRGHAGAVGRALEKERPTTRSAHDGAHSRHAGMLRLDRRSHPRRGQVANWGLSSPLASRAAILASSAAVNAVSAKAVGHMVPS